MELLRRQSNVVATFLTPAAINCCEDLDIQVAERVSCPPDAAPDSKVARVHASPTRQRQTGKTNRGATAATSAKASRSAFEAFVAVASTGPSFPRPPQSETSFSAPPFGACVGAPVVAAQAMENESSGVASLHTLDKTCVAVPLARAHGMPEHTVPHLAAPPLALPLYAPAPQMSTSQQTTPMGVAPQQVHGASVQTPRAVPPYAPSPQMAGARQEVQEASAAHEASAATLAAPLFATPPRAPLSQMSPSPETAAPLHLHEGAAATPLAHHRSGIELQAASLGMHLLPQEPPPAPVPSAVRAASQQSSQPPPLQVVEEGEVAGEEIGILDQESGVEVFEMLSEEISAIVRGEQLPGAATVGELPFVRVVPSLSDQVTGGVFSAPLPATAGGLPNSVTAGELPFVLPVPFRRDSVTVGDVSQPLPVVAEIDAEMEDGFPYSVAAGELPDSVKAQGLPYAVTVGCYSAETTQDKSGPHNVEEIQIDAAHAPLQGDAAHSHLDSLAALSMPLLPPT